MVEPREHMRVEGEVLVSRRSSTEIAVCKAQRIHGCGCCREAHAERVGHIEDAAGCGTDECRRTGAATAGVRDEDGGITRSCGAVAAGDGDSIQLIVEEIDVEAML
eukprot:3159413-Prymnesium_polylepis.1